MAQTLGYYPAAIESPAPGTVFPQYYTNVRANLAGELPPDVLDLLQTQAAQYGIASGLPGSQFSGYRGLRNLGLTSLQRMDVGAQQMAPLFAQQASQERYYQQHLLEQEAMNERARQAAVARAAEASKWWTTGGGTPQIVGGYGGGRSPSAPGMPRTNASEVVSNILSRYSPYGTASSPLRMAPEEENPYGEITTRGYASTPFGYQAPTYGRDIMMSGAPTESMFDMSAYYPSLGGYLPKFEGVQYGQEPETEFAGAEY